MRVVFLMEAGIPNYRNFLFDHLSKHVSVSELIVLHTGRIYDGKVGNYKDKKIKFLGSNKLGIHIGIFKYLVKGDVIVSSYNLRIISCWLPAVIFRKKWIFWGKGLGKVESPLVFFLRRLTSKWCRYLLVYNEVKKQELINRLGVNPTKVIAYQNSVSISNGCDCQGDYKTSFLYFGRIQERKGLIELIRAYKVYVDRVSEPRYRLRFVGDGMFKEKLVDEVKKIGISELVDFFPGVYDEDSILEHFKTAVFYVSPFNVGLGVVNSFAYGVPVLTCEKPQVGPEFHYLEEKNSIIVSDVSEFSDVFVGIDKEGSTKHKVFEYYKENLHHSIMLENFTDTILKVKNE